MDKFPEDLSVIIVDDVFDNYTLAFEDGADTVHVHCETCDDTVCILSYEDISETEKMDLYEQIIDTHRAVE